MAEEKTHQEQVVQEMARALSTMSARNVKLHHDLSAALEEIERKDELIAKLEVQVLAMSTMPRDFVVGDVVEFAPSKTMYRAKPGAKAVVMEIRPGYVTVEWIRDDLFSTQCDGEYYKKDFRLAPESAFPIGTRVRKTKGSSWQGRVCGYYSTDLTPFGICVESERESGSVQIYPASALEVVHDEEGK